MSDELKPPTEEETVDAPVKEAPVVPDEEDAEDESVTVEDLKSELDAIGKRVKSAGLGPLRRVAGLYANALANGIDDVLSALEGKKRKGD